MPSLPDDAVQAALSAYRAALADRPDPMVLPDERLMRIALEAAAPAMAAHAAQAILAQKEPCPEHPMPFPKPSCWTCGRNGAFRRAAMIAAGTWTGPEAMEGTDGSS